MNDALRMPHERCLIGGHEHFAIADADHHWAAVACHDDTAGFLRVDRRDPIGAGDDAQHGAKSIFQAFLGHGGEQVCHDFRIGFGSERDAGGLQFRSQRPRILDDAVVNDRESVGGIGVRVRVAIARFAMRRPARVRDAAGAFQLFGQDAFQVAYLALSLHDGELAAATDGEACRVIAPILETMQSIHEDRCCVARSHIPNNSTHPARSTA